MHITVHKGKSIAIKHTTEMKYIVFQFGIIHSELSLPIHSCALLNELVYLYVDRVPRSWWAGVILAAGFIELEKTRHNNIIEFIVWATDSIAKV